MSEGELTHSAPKDLEYVLHHKFSITRTENPSSAARPHIGLGILTIESTVRRKACESLQENLYAENVRKAMGSWDRGEEPPD